MEFLKDLVTYRIDIEKLRRFEHATDEDRGIVKGMALIVAEINSIQTEIEQRKKRGDNA